MRLQKIKLAGFKSFVDPTVFILPSNLVGVVGPNGCGKSNIIDAVRWVMGEGSAKNLRGGSMSDVIFSGSSSRKSVGQAFVELIFDNTDHTLGGEFAEYNEIAIKRLLSRDGQSQYFLNGSRCRRRDITDIFLGTGLGPRSYAIIEQGMISKLIEAKPEELRVFLEEAAGISKYKDRRRETETRIRHTRENLARLADLRGEVEKQLGHLQRQANTAEKYQRLNQELQRYQAETIGLKLRDLAQESERNKALIQSQAIDIESKLGIQRHIEANLEKQRLLLHELNEQLQMVQESFYQKGTEVTRIEQSIQHQADLQQRTEQDLAQVKEAKQAIEVHLETDQQTLLMLQAQLEDDTPLQAELETEMELAEVRVEQADQALHDWQENWETLNQKMLEPRRVSEVERTKATQIEQQLQRLEQRQQQLEHEHTGLSTQAMATEVVSLQSQLETAEMVLLDYQDQQHFIDEQLLLLRDQQQQSVQDMAQIQAESAKIQGHYTSLQALQSEVLKAEDQALNTWLQSHHLQHQPHLLEMIKVMPGWEKAVELVLGFMLESVCVETKIMADAIPGLTLLETHSANDQVPPENTLATKVCCQWLLPWLHSVFIAPDLAQALLMSQDLTPNQSVITQDGIWVGDHWLRYHASNAENNVLQRQQMMNDLEAKQNTLENQQQTLEQQQAAQKQEIVEVEQKRAYIQQEISQNQRQLNEWQVQLSAKQTRLEHLQQREIEVKNELDQVKTQINQDKSHYELARSCVHEALTQLEAFAEQQQLLEQQREELRYQVQLSREAMQPVREQSQAVALRIESAESKQTMTEQQITRLEAQISQLQQRHDDLLSQQSQADMPVETLQQQLEFALAQHQTLQAQLQEVRDKVVVAEQQLRDQETEKQEAEQLGQKLHQAMDQQRLLQQEYQTRWQMLEEQLLKITDIELEVLWQGIPEQADVTTWQTQVEQIEQKIQRLGAINLAAIDEYAEQSERKQYLDAQNNDLEDALNTLETAINKIDKETRQRFQQTFTQVNEGVQAMFPRLFGGGKAYLELTGDDLLNAGVTIMARPPGKRNSTIHALSGGEKALTAVALVFSIFELNPSPFCMLDEVDAPLDDANVGRFCDMVRTMSERVQFIFITHNKVTMELANQLTGVTMHEPGVSRLVAVDVDAAVQMAIG